jgi:dihydrodipicolinate reductase
MDISKEEIAFEKNRIFYAKFGGGIISKINYIDATYTEKCLIKKTLHNKIMFDAGFNAAIDFMKEKENESYS